MTASKKESLSLEELEQVSGGGLRGGLVYDQSSLFMEDGTAHDTIGANRAHVNVGISVSAI